jgi:DNA-binding transcriptional LysR family regulator
MLDVKRMRVLREVAARGSFSAAAEALSYTQSAVSQQISALEREAGTILVERGARGIRLTEAGHAIVQHADAILSRLADAEAELEALAGLEGGRLRIGGFATAAASLLPPALATFKRRYPNVALSLTIGEPEDLLDGLRTGDVDLSIVFQYDNVPACAYTNQFDGTDFEPLFDDPFRVALPQDHPYARRARVPLDELRDARWIQANPRGLCGTALISACHEAGFEPQIVFESDDYSIVQGLIAAGIGVSLIPELARVNARTDVVFRPLSTTPPVRRIGVATVAEGYRSPGAEKMIGIMRATVKDHVAARPPLRAVS